MLVRITEQIRNVDESHNAVALCEMPLPPAADPPTTTTAPPVFAVTVLGGCSYQVYAGIDSGNGDIGMIRVASGQECTSLCDAQPECRAAEHIGGDC